MNISEVIDNLDLDSEHFDDLMARPGLNIRE